MECAVTEATGDPTSTPDPWLPDLSDTLLTDLGGMDLGAARARLIKQTDRPTASVAGSEGS